MRPLPLILVSAAACLALGGCDYNEYTDNGQVTVKNRTDKTIVVHYDTEYVSGGDGCGCDEGGDVDVYHQHAHIRSGGEKTLFVDSLFWDGLITVEYDGEWQAYDVDFDVLGFDTIWVREDDFMPKGNG